jgi:hypothetical protein
MGKVVASACRTDGGWSFFGEVDWAVDSNGEITAYVPEKPAFGVILHQRRDPEELLNLYQAGRESEIITLAREMVAEEIEIPTDATVRVESQAGQRSVVFLGEDENGEEFCYAAVQLGGDAGDRVVAPRAGQ